MIDNLGEKKSIAFFESASENVAKYIKQIKSDFRRHREPVNFSFRDICSKWIKRSDKYTHLIHSYPAKLMPYIPIFFLFDPSYANKKGYLMDPFAGTGTVLLEGIIHPFNKMNTLGVEINPLARLISKVKTTPLDLVALQKKARELIANIQTTSRHAEIPKFPNINFWFKEKAQIDLAKIRYRIERLENSHFKDFFGFVFHQSFDSPLWRTRESRRQSS